MIRVIDLFFSIILFNLIVNKNRSQYFFIISPISMIDIDFIALSFSFKNHRDKSNFYHCSNQRMKINIKLQKSHLI